MIKRKKERKREIKRKRERKKERRTGGEGWRNLCQGNYQTEIKRGKEKARKVSSSTNHCTEANWSYS